MRELDTVVLKHETAFDVMAAFARPVEVHVLAVVGHAVCGIATAPRFHDEIAILKIARKEGVQLRVDALFLVYLRAFQFGDAGSNALGQGIFEILLHRAAAMIEDTVDAEIKFGQVHAQDVVLDQADEFFARGHALSFSARW